MDFVVSAPEVNSLRMYLGAGSGPMLAAAAAWDGLADELAVAASWFGSVTSGLADAAWRGPAAVAMARAVAPYLGWLISATAQAEQAAAQARVAVATFEAARAATVHPAIVAANRAVLVSLVSSNLLGFNAPAIAATEAAYERMWAQDVAAMVGYHAGASAAVSALMPFTQQLKKLAGLSERLTSAAAAAAGPPSAAGFNLGLANVGANNVGNGNVGVFNVGFGNLGSYNLGFANLGSDNLGLANLGGHNIGFANTGSNNVGFGNTGSNNVGIGLTGNGQIGFGSFNSGSHNIGLFNSGSGNVGLFNSGTGNFGIGNSGTGNFGLGNTGSTNTGWFNTGDVNTGGFNPGSYNTGNFNTGKPRPDRCRYRPRDSRHSDKRAAIQHADTSGDGHARKRDDDSGHALALHIHCSLRCLLRPGRAPAIHAHPSHGDDHRGRTNHHDRRQPHRHGGGRQHPAHQDSGGPGLRELDHQPVVGLLQRWRRHRLGLRQLRRRRFGLLEPGLGNLGTFGLRERRRAGIGCS
ncbi:PPE family protein [Mycobacterium tuberculosis]|uniref:PPE family protein n=1 Tax=Mycobacterium tuberculosis TaxID=1773 RepID=UPI003CC509A2